MNWVAAFWKAPLVKTRLFFTENLLSLSITQSSVASSFSSSTWQVASDLRKATLYFLTGVSVWWRFGYLSVSYSLELTKWWSDIVASRMALVFITSERPRWRWRNRLDASAQTVDGFVLPKSCSCWNTVWRWQVGILCRWWVTVYHLNSPSHLHDVRVC